MRVLLLGTFPVQIIYVTERRRNKALVVFYLFGLFGQNFSCPPRHDVEVTQGVEDEEEVHGRYTEVVQETGDDTPELLRVKQGRDEETARQGHQEDERWRPDAVFTHLQRDAHNDSHHDESVHGTHDLC